MSVSLCFRCKYFRTELVVWIKHFMAYQGLTCLESFENSSAVGRGTCIVCMFVCACRFVCIWGRERLKPNEWEREIAPCGILSPPLLTPTSGAVSFTAGDRLCDGFLMPLTLLHTYTHTHIRHPVRLWAHTHTNPSKACENCLHADKQILHFSLSLQHWSSMTA